MFLFDFHEKFACKFTIFIGINCNLWGEKTRKRGKVQESGCGLSDTERGKTAFYRNLESQKLHFIGIKRLIPKVSDLLESFINKPARQFVGKTRWVFRRPNGGKSGHVFLSVIQVDYRHHASSCLAKLPDEILMD
jgi:hypothetical protein